MKNLTLYITCIILIASASGCSDRSKIIGHWSIGEIDDQSGNEYRNELGRDYYFDFREDKSIAIRLDTVNYDGTWEITDGKLIIRKNNSNGEEVFVYTLRSFDGGEAELTLDDETNGRKFKISLDRYH